MIRCGNIMFDSETAPTVHDAASQIIKYTYESESTLVVLIFRYTLIKSVYQ